MILGVDADVLISWAMRGSLRHSDARRLIDFEIRERGSSLAITPQVVYEFLHVVTDPRRFEQPFPMEEAIQQATQICNSEDVILLAPTPPVVPRTMELMGAFRLGRKRILDTALAATLELAGIRRLATFNPGDFQVFDFLELVGSPP